MVLIFSSLLALIMAWKVSVQLNFLRFILFLIFCVVLLFLTPYFLTFIERSSVNIANVIWYIFGIGSFLLIFGGFWVAVKKKTAPSRTFNRIFGSIIFGVIVFTSIVIIVLSLRDAGILDVSTSRIINLLHLN